MNFAKIKSSYTKKENKQGREEISLRKGEEVAVLEIEGEWLKGSRDNGEVGWFPKANVKEFLAQKSAKDNRKSFLWFKRKESKQDEDVPKDKTESGNQLLKKTFDFLSRKKKEDDTSGSEAPTEAPKETIYASCLQDLPEDILRKIKRANIDEELLDKHFDVLCNVLRFTTKRTIVKDRSRLEKSHESTNLSKSVSDDMEVPENKEKKSASPRKRTDPSRSNVDPEMLKMAEPSILYTNPKKAFRRAEFTGKGGFGRVFYAKSTMDKGEKVAVKKMPHNTPKEKRMNLDEIAILNYCNHPNICKYFRSFIFENEAAIVMEYLEGGTLSEAAKRFDFEESHIAFIAREMLQGISYLHQNKLIHRDLKSSNVMLSISGEIKLIDFGLTIAADRCRVHMVGSPFWMPPEMIRSKPHSYPADIWSFAICMIEMADKKPPHRKARLKAMFICATVGLMSHLEAAKYSDEFKDFLTRCLQQDPADRATADELLQHPFLKKASDQKAMETVLREIFLSNAFEHSGFFI